MAHNTSSIGAYFDLLYSLYNKIFEKEIGQENVAKTKFDEWNFEMNKIINKSKTVNMANTAILQRNETPGQDSGKTIQIESSYEDECLNSSINSSKPKKILIVDESLTFRRFLSQLLELEGHYCELAPNGLVALNMVKATLSMTTDDLYLRNYDVIIINLMMPVMNGFDATLAIREHGYTGTIVGMSACEPDDIDITEAFLKAGATRVVSKPLQIEEVYFIISSS